MFPQLSVISYISVTVAIKNWTLKLIVFTVVHSDQMVSIELAKIYIYSETSLSETLN